MLPLLVHFYKTGNVKWVSVNKAFYIGFATERIKRRFLCLPKATCFLWPTGWAGLMYKNFTFQRIQHILPCTSTHVTVWLRSVVQNLSTNGPWRVVSWHIRIWIPVLFCFTIAVWVESVVQCRTGKQSVYSRYWCHPVICLEALKATTMNPQNTLCQGWESKLVPPEQERQLITHHDLRPWLIFSLFNLLKSTGYMMHQTV